MKNFKTILTTLCLFAFSSFLYSADAYLTNFNLHKFVKNNTPYALGVTVKNNSTSTFTTFNVSWQLDNGIINTSQNLNFSSGLGQNSYYDFVHPVHLNISNDGEYQIKIWINAVGETNPSNDTIVKNIIVLNQYANMTSLFELYSSTTCPSCPAGLRMSDSVSKIPGNNVAVFVSNGTPVFQNATSYFYSKYFPTASGFTPAGIFNMGDFGQYTINSQSPTWPTTARNKSNQISPASIEIIPNLNSATRELSIELKANIKYIEDGQYFLNLYITENGITGSQSGTGGTFTYNNIVRAMLDGINGDSTTFPSSPLLNTNYTKSYTHIIPSNWNINRLSLIGILFIKKDNKYNVVNSIKHTFDQTSIENISIVDNNLATIYPNPFTDIINIQFNQNIKNGTIELMTINGQIVTTKSITTDEGDQIQLNTLNISSGLYILKISSSDRVYYSKIQKL
jgi:hypothetical protein